MKRRTLILILAMSLTAAVIYGCGKKEAPAPEQPEAPAEESSVEEVAVEASTEASSAEEIVKEPARPTSLDDAIGLAILSFNEDRYSKGEVAGEGHILMDKEDDEATGEQKCYVLSMYGQYEFQDGNLVKCSGSGVIPCVITLKLNDDGEYGFVSLVEAEDGSNFVPSIKENFPEALWARCITTDDDDRNELDKQEKSYAEEYRSSIGREDAEVGDYADFDHELLTDLGVSEKVSNALLDVESGEGFESSCPLWVGEREVLEGDTRYVYKKEYDKKKKTITYSMVNYDTGEVVESSVYSAKTGEKVK